MKDVRDALMIAHNSDGKLVRRPLSPHLQVYRPQLTSILSIMNRVTGLAISAGTLMLVWWLVAAATGPSAFDRVQWFVGTPVGLFMLFGWTASLFYHFFNGVRHLAWDAGYGFELPQTHVSGWAAIVATVVATVLTWAAGFWMLHS
jgi:succinate dehydrogenase cytochrome b subunit